MKIIGPRSKKAIFIVIGAIVALMALVIILISPIAKYLIEKYDEKYTGRQIETGWVYVNPFTGYIHISNLKIYESRNRGGFMKDDSIFFTAKGLSVNFAMLKFLSKTIEISEITLNQPRGIVIQNKKEFNFFDLIKKFTPDKADKTPSKIHFDILNIKISAGEFYYREKSIPINYFITKVDLESAGKRWNADTIGVKFSLFPGTGSGDMNGDFTINFKTGDYRYAVLAHKFGLNIIEQYLKDLTNHGSFSANLDADMEVSGNFADQENMNGSGMLAINDFHFGKNPATDYASFDKLALTIIKINPKNHQYLFDSVSLSHPFVLYERYDYLDNVQAIFGKNGVNIANAAADPAKFNLVIEIARYVKVLAKNFFQSEYKINRLAIYQGDLKYNDYAISEKFTVNLNPLNVTADSIDKKHDWVNVDFNSGIKPYGNVLITLRINPKDSMDFDIHYQIRKVPLALFNPYLVTYTSFPLDRGTLEIIGTWNVRNGMINSNNHLLIIDPRRTGRVRNKDKKWLPLPLIMSLVRERGNVIDYEIPITGDLKNPKFHFHDVLMDMLENIFVKPATASYRLEVKNIEAEIEEFFTLKWEMRTSVLQRNQEKFIDKLAGFLRKNPNVSITVYPIAYADKEKEYILFFEAKKKYYLMINHKNARSFSTGDSERVDKMSVKDAMFVHYLNKLSADTMLHKIQDKCGNYIGSVLVSARFEQLSKERERAFMFQFRENDVEGQVKILKAENKTPYNGFSFFKITYNGPPPANVIKAHLKMNELNNKGPRKKYNGKRKKYQP